MLKILITGSTGFIGKFLTVQLKKDGYDIFEFNQYSTDIADIEAWKFIPKVDLVIHTAALTSVPDSWTNSYKYFKTNLLGTICVLEYCKNFNTRLIFLSSYLYENKENLPTSEDSNLKCYNLYALSKKNAEEVCEFYSNNFNLSITILRPFNIYGPGQKENFLIPHIINQICTKKEIKVKDLKPKRDYIYIYDLINLIRKIINYDNKFNIINAGSGISYSVLEIINIIQNVMGTNLNIITTDENRKSEIFDTVADITKANLFYNWFPEWTFKEGITDIINNLPNQNKI